MTVREITPDVDPAPWLAGAQFIDAYRIEIGGGTLDAREAATKMFARSPRWVETLLNLRNLIVAPLGLKTSGAGERAAGGEDKHDGRGDIEKSKLVAAGAADIEHRAGQACGVEFGIDRPRKQRLDKGRDFRRRLTFRAESLEKAGLRAVRHVFRDQLRHRTPDIPDGQIAAINLRNAPPPAPREPGRAYFVGDAKCGACHKEALAFWKKTVHADAWQTLVEVDKQYNYDCIGCHVTGWQKAGGVNLATVEKRSLVDVQCEVCHGPGSKHVAAAGLEDKSTMVRRPSERFCSDNCHTREHSDTFALVPYLRDILGKGHGEAARKQPGDGVTGHELRQKALEAAAK